MIAKYKNNYFNISAKGIAEKRIWKYQPIKGFSLKIKDDGLKVYERIVPISEIECIFNVVFQVKWNSLWWGVNHACAKDFSKFSLGTSNQQEAKKYDFKGTEMDRGQYCGWEKEVTFEEITDFRIVITDMRTKESTIEDVSFDEFKNYHREFIYNLSPWNFYNN